MLSYTTEVISRFTLSSISEIAINELGTSNWSIISDSDWEYHSGDDEYIDFTVTNRHFKSNQIRLMANGSPCAYITLSNEINLNKVREFIGKITTVIDSAKGRRIELSIETAYSVHRTTNVTSHVNGVTSSDISQLGSNTPKMEFTSISTGNYGADIGNITPSSENTMGLGVENSITNFNPTFQNPSGYRQCDYIENTGDDTRINLEYKLQVGDVVEVIARIPIKPLTSYQGLLGARKASNNHNSFAIWTVYNNKYEFGFGRNTADTNSETVKTFGYYGQIVRFNVSGTTLSIRNATGVELSSVATDGVATGDADSKLIAFGINTSGTGNDVGCKAAIYLIRILNGSQVKRIYTPVVDSNNIPGFYESVSGRFCTDTNNYSYIKYKLRDRSVAAPKFIDKSIKVITSYGNNIRRFESTYDFVTSPIGALSLISSDENYIQSASRNLGYRTWLLSDEVHGLYLASVIPNPDDESKSIMMFIGSKNYQNIELCDLDLDNKYLDKSAKPRILRVFNNVYLGYGENIYVVKARNSRIQSDRVINNLTDTQISIISDRILMPTSDLGYLAYGRNGKVYNLLKSNNGNLEEVDFSTYTGSLYFPADSNEVSIIKSIAARNLSILEADRYFNMPSLYYDDMVIRYTWSASTGLDRILYVTSNLNSGYVEINEDSASEFRTYHQIRNLMNIQLSTYKFETTDSDFECYYELGGQLNLIKGPLTGNITEVQNPQYITLHHRGVSVNITTNGEFA